MNEKRNREKLELIQLEDGTIIPSESGKIKEIHNFYSSMFTSSGYNARIASARNTILENTMSKITDIDKTRMETCPTLNELKSILDLFPKKKSPGIDGSWDGLTSEVYEACWSFLGEDFLALVLAFWETTSLPHSFKTGVLKLIPKKPDRRFLKDWSPLTMLTIVYKVIAKLLAMRLAQFSLA